MKLAWVTGWISSLPATILTLFQGAYFKPMQLALLQLLGSVYLAMNEAGVGYRLDIFPARHNLDTIPRRLF
jgi:hypothetical protein